MLHTIKRIILVFVKRTILLWRPIYRLIIGAKKYPLSKGKEIINKAKKHLNQALSSPVDLGMPMSERWDEYSRMIRNEINKMKYAHQAIYYCQGYIGFDHRELAAVQLTYFPKYENTLKAEFPNFSKMISSSNDSPYSLPETLIRYKGRLVSNMSYFHLRYVLQCLTYVKEPKMICEIGGGYGGPARLWLQNPVCKPKTYVIVDLPESLFFAEVFLHMNFKENEILYITDSRPINPEEASKYSVILCPVNFTDSVSRLSFDLVINTGSLNEMTEEWVDFWMEWIDKQDCRFFYSQNFFAQRLDFMAEGCSTWTPRLKKDWRIRLQVFNPHFVMQQTYRSVGEILAEKLSAADRTPEPILVAQYESTKERYLDGQMLMEAIDIFRICPREDINLDLLVRCVNEMNPIPKEAYYLAEYLNTHASPDFMSNINNEFKEIRSKLHSIRAAGRENLT
ncbi:putative sugar O-methyltransferase [Candidatus Margulisiibacteriota bacterium]